MLLTSVIALLLYVGTYALGLIEAGTFGARNPALLPEDLSVAQSTLTGFLVLCGLLLVIFVEPPSPWWVGGNRLNGDHRPALLALAMMAVFVLITMIPPLRALFLLSPLGLREYALLALAVTIWLFTVRLTWRTRLLSRYLSVDLDEPPTR
jgi:cation-transporting ATPase E